MLLESEKKELRSLARNKLNLPKNATIERIIKELNSSQINQNNFYSQMVRFKKADDKLKEKERLKILQENAKQKAIEQQQLAKLKAEQQLAAIKRKTEQKLFTLQAKKEEKGFLQNFNFEPIETKPIRKYPQFDIKKIDKYVEFWHKKNNNKNERFSIKLMSTKADITHTFKFTNMFQFYNWLKKIKDDEILNSDSSQVKYYNEIFNMNNLFDDVVFIKEIKLITGGCNKHCAGDKKLKSAFYEYKLFNPVSDENNCFFKALGYLLKINLDIKKIRKEFNLKAGTEITINDGYRVIQSLDSDVEIIDYDTNEELDSNKKYIVFKNNHYYAMENFKEINRKDIKTKRGLLTFDFETRATEEYNVIKATGQKMYILKDTICGVYYAELKQPTANFILKSNSEKTSARQFIDWLNQQAKKNKSYHCIAHNGGKFDFYFIISVMTEKEMLECEFQMRGTTIIGINYRGNLFKDSCCFLTDSLSNLSKSFKVSEGKITELELYDNKISSTQLCYYKNELSFNEFLELEYNEPEFWNLYTKYCLYDCISLYQIWLKFTECINGLIEKINPYLLSKCPLMASSTIGSHSKKIIVEVNKYKGIPNNFKKDIELFTGVSYDKKEKKTDMDKYNFLCNFKRGGISHCNQAGKHLSGITGVDIASQYPASLIHAHIPIGESYWLDDKKKFNNKLYGFYLISNIEFDSDYQLRPVALSLEGKALDWSADKIEFLYVDSYMIDYLIENFGLKSFTIDKALVSKTHIKADKIFGKYVNTFYDEKKLQDELNKSNDENYNPALRTTIKLYLNSLTGKLVENPSIHFTMKLFEKAEENAKSFNGIEYEKTFNTDKINDWLIAGIMVYSYSKRLLFEYIKCLPNKSNDVIHIETDGIYFSTKHLNEFSKNLKNYKGEYPCCFGDDLGNLKIEKSTEKGQVAYFLGKKFYCITMNDNYINKVRDNKDKNIYRVKGIPQTTLNPDGSSKYLVDVGLYNDIFNGQELQRTFSTLKKTLFTEKASIATYEMTRTIKPNCSYKLYE